MGNENMKAASNDALELIIPEGEKNVNKGTIMEDEERSAITREKSAGN